MAKRTFGSVVAIVGVVFTVIGKTNLLALFLNKKIGETGLFVPDFPIRKFASKRFSSIFIVQYQRFCDVTSAVTAAVSVQSASPENHLPI